MHTDIYDNLVKDSKGTIKYMPLNTNIPLSGTIFGLIDSPDIGNIK